MKRGHKPFTFFVAAVKLPLMARKPRNAPGGLAYHVMNRTWGEIDLFEDAGDYEAFECVLAQAVEREKTMRVSATIA